MRVPNKRGGNYYYWCFAIRSHNTTCCVVIVVANVRGAKRDGRYWLANCFDVSDSKPRTESNKRKSVTWSPVRPALRSPWSKELRLTSPRTVRSSAPDTSPTRTVTNRWDPTCPPHPQSQSKSRNPSGSWLPSPARPNQSTSKRRRFLWHENSSAPSVIIITILLCSTNCTLCNNFSFIIINFFFYHDVILLSLSCSYRHYVAVIIPHHTIVTITSRLFIISINV